jgi:hypothetical protein
MNETTPSRKVFDLLSERDPWVETMSAEPADELTLESVEEIRRLLQEKPQETLLDAPAILGPNPTYEEAMRLIDETEAALRDPAATAVVLESLSNEFEERELPPRHQFPGYDPTHIPITPFARKFETLADAPAWGLTAMKAWVWRRTHPKPAFPRHTDARPFVYPLNARNGRLTVALFSDAANGYYHAQYIMKHVGMVEASAAIHLGDVYYTGREFEVSRYLEAPLKHVLDTTPFFAMNANHEMDSHGTFYFDFLRRKRANAPALQVQEGSYFCLVADKYQVIGIDTAFFANGRHNDAQCRAWLQDRLAEGRAAQKINILLTQNEPYNIGDTAPSKLLDPDLRDVQDQIDIWFWGDQHYAALYGRKAFPFYGSCIGHAGYPFYTLEEGGAHTDLAPTLWEETEPRFPKDLNWRQDVGNNGWCLLGLGDDALELTYFDWRQRTRKVANFPLQAGRLR